jgi:rod shape-determining protein MreD
MNSDIVKWVALFMLVLILQTSFLPVISIAGIKPDLLMIALFFFSLKYGVTPGLFVGFFLGLAQDLYAPAILGQNALTKTVIGAFVGLFNERMMRTDLLIKTILLLVTFLLHDILFMIIQIIKLAGPVSVLFTDLFTKTLPRALYSLAVAALISLWESLPKPVTRK